jgi:hypothetical protein
VLRPGSRSTIERYLNDGAVLFDPATLGNRDACRSTHCSWPPAQSKVMFYASIKIQTDGLWPVVILTITNAAITPLDLDGDGIPNASDPCPTDPTNTTCI